MRQHISKLWGIKTARFSKENLSTGAPIAAPPHLLVDSLGVDMYFKPSTYFSFPTPHSVAHTQFLFPEYLG